MKLRSVFALVLSLLMVSLAAGGAALAADWSDIYDGSYASVVQVRGLGETWSGEGGLKSEVTARGSGLYLGEGRIATNAHLVEDCDDVEIEDASGKTIAVKEILTDDTIDLAILLLEEDLEGVEPLSLDGEVRVAQEAMIIGHLTATDGVLTHTASRCTISGLDRDGEALGVFSRRVWLIQTDCALYGGFAGAALLNDQGCVAGMMVMPRVENEAEPSMYYGPGFALPAADIARAAADLVAYGTVKRPRMGVMVSAVDGPEEALRNWPPCGMAIVEIEEDGPADKAGVKLYDIITEVDGVRIHDFNELSAILDKREGGDTIHLKIYRCYDEEGNMTENPEYVELDLTLEMR